MMGKQPFETVVATHGAAVLRVCRAVLGGTDADDAWSETFLSAMKAYPGLPADANVEAWLVTIAHRKAIDVTRTRARRAIPVAETPDTATAPRRDLELDGDLAGALAALPPKQKQAVPCHYLAGRGGTDRSPSGRIRRWHCGSTSRRTPPVVALKDDLGPRATAPLVVHVNAAVLHLPLLNDHARKTSLRSSRSGLWYGEQYCCRFVSALPGVSLGSPCWLREAGAPDSSAPWRIVLRVLRKINYVMPGVS